MQASYAKPTVCLASDIDAHGAVPGMALNSCSIAQLYTNQVLSEAQSPLNDIFTGPAVFSWMRSAGVILNEEIIFVFP